MGGREHLCAKWVPDLARAQRDTARSCVSFKPAPSGPKLPAAKLASRVSHKPDQQPMLAAPGGGSSASASSRCVLLHCRATGGTDGTHLAAQVGQHVVRDVFLCHGPWVGFQRGNLVRVAAGGNSRAQPPSGRGVPTGARWQFERQPGVFAWQMGGSSHGGPAGHTISLWGAGSARRIAAATYKGGGGGAGGGEGGGGGGGRHVYLQWGYPDEQMSASLLAAHPLRYEAYRRQQGCLLKLRQHEPA